jgi:hypothetical protein
MLDRLLAPPAFPLAEAHAGSVTTLGLALFYAPILPLSPFIALAALLIASASHKWVALRRAAAPANLSGLVTAPLNWLLRLLPLVQLVLMRQLYFVVRSAWKLPYPCLFSLSFLLFSRSLFPTAYPNPPAHHPSQGHPAVYPVFWAGLAAWALSAVAPLRAFLGVVRRRRPAPAGGVPYHRLLGGKRAAAAGGAPELFGPAVPRACSRAFRKRVDATFAALAPAASLSSLGAEDAGALRALHASPAAAAPAPPGAALARGGDANRRAHPSLRGSVAAGVYGTLDLFWNPHDPDHPEDVFVRPEAGPEPSGGSGGAIGGGGGGATPRHRSTGSVGSTGAPGAPGGGGGGGGTIAAVRPAALPRSVARRPPRPRHDPMAAFAPLGAGAGGDGLV